MKHSTSGYGKAMASNHSIAIGCATHGRNAVQALRDSTRVSSIAFVLSVTIMSSAPDCVHAPDYGYTL